MIVSALAVTVSTSAHAAMLTQATANNSPETFDAVPQDGAGTLGYAFIGAITTTPPNNYLDPAPVVSDLPSSFSVSFSGSSVWSHSNNSTLTIAGEDHTTGQYDGNITITLGEGAPSSFSFGVLTNNGVDISWNFDVAADNSFTIQNQLYSTGNNHFYFVDVTDAAAGDTIMITTPSNDGRVSGVVFVPEPASLAMLGAGGLLMLVRRRQPRQA
ncbi:MAG: PEP-CTERM sorting domain-containing protein [Phycisphaeraceae bacterium]